MRFNIHPTQSAILTDLRKSDSLRFSQLSNKSDLDADVFKFHVKSLVKRGLILKNHSSKYELTTPGKELANKIDEDSSAIKLSPKLSMLFVIRDVNHPDRVLLQRRLRHPFYNYWGLLSGPIPWGISTYQAAKDEVLKQTGYNVEPNVIGTLREVNKIADQNQVIEDKFFIVIEVTVSASKQQHAWEGGQNMWIDISEVASLKPVFNNTLTILDPSRDAYSCFSESTVTYDSNDY